MLIVVFNARKVPIMKYLLNSEQKIQVLGSRIRFLGISRGGNWVFVDVEMARNRTKWHGVGHLVVEQNQSNFDATNVAAVLPAHAGRLDSDGNEVGIADIVRGRDFTLQILTVEGPSQGVGSLWHLQTQWHITSGTTKSRFMNLYL